MLTTNYESRVHEWLAKIEAAEFLNSGKCGSEELYWLRLRDSRGNVEEVWMDDETMYRYLEETVVGTPYELDIDGFEELAGRWVVAILDRHGDIVAFRTPFPRHDEMDDGGRLLPPSAYRPGGVVE